MRRFTLDGKGHWQLVYGPIHENYDGTDVYDEPRYLFQDMNKPGFWSKEVPMRYTQEQVWHEDLHYYLNGGGMWKSKVTLIDKHT